MEEITRREDEIEIQEDIQETEDLESGPPEYAISTYPADYTLWGLYDMWNQSDIIIPDFQRRFVWKQEQSSKLIESFLTDLPVPSIFLYTEKNSNKYLVIDGQQRLRSIFYYFDGFFGEEVKGKKQVFKLKGLNENSRWAGKNYESMGEADRRKLRNCVLRSFVINQTDPKDETSIYHIFERLNTGGTNLASQEIRNCIYHGDYNNSLNELNKFPAWRKILGKTVLDNRQRDVELILRVFAMTKIDDYDPPFKDFLSKYMSKHKNDSQAELLSQQNRFKDTCDIIYSKLGEKPFHIIRGINTAVLDSVFTTIFNNYEKLPENIETRYQSLIQDSEFQKVISGPISNPGVVAKRFELAEIFLFGN